MKTYAKVVEVLPPISGTSDNGNDWEKQTVVFETTGIGPHTLAIEFMGERKTRVIKRLNVGQLCEVTFEPVSRRWEDKWFTHLEGYKVTPFAAAGVEDPAAGEEKEPSAPFKENEEMEALFNE